MKYVLALVAVCAIVAALSVAWRGASPVAAGAALIERAATPPTGAAPAYVSNADRSSSSVSRREHSAPTPPSSAPTRVELACEVRHAVWSSATHPLWVDIEYVTKGRSDSERVDLGMERRFVRDITHRFEHPDRAPDAIELRVGLAAPGWTAPRGTSWRSVKRIDVSRVATRPASAGPLRLLALLTGPPPALVSGRVRSNGAPVYADVHWRPFDDEEPRAWSSFGRYCCYERGEFEIPTRGRGRALLHLRADGTAPAKIEFEAREVGLVDVGTIELPLGESIAGRTTPVMADVELAFDPIFVAAQDDGSGEDVEELRTGAHPFHALRVKVRTDSFGRFEATGFVRGRYRATLLDIPGIGIVQCADEVRAPQRDLVLPFEICPVSIHVLREGVDGSKERFEIRRRDASGDFATRRGMRTDRTGFAHAWAAADSDFEIASGDVVLYLHAGARGQPLAVRLEL